MNLFPRYLKNPQAHEIAKVTLEDHKRHLLTQESLAAYHAKMAEYYRESIHRLSQYPQPIAAK